MLYESTTTDSKYKGVRKRKWGKWVSEIRLPNCRERIWLGSYDSAEKAARAFDAALFCLRGRTAKFNFPDNPPEIDGGRSLSPPEIQVAAARHANSEPPKAESEHALTDQSAWESQLASPCPSVVSDGTAQLDSNELTPHGSFLDLLMDSNVGSGVHSAEYGIFSGFDDFFPPPSVHYEAESFDSVLVEDSFLWNF
ncbi:hypothetical protein K2173_017472 [Erythroxylum novogranatense]|uniref:AP2/ERF domain-containing protein n=1 Tax=Erythroxylum novogranatense TaxID=1862640 RepID=A0AAV8TL26_9ROSI|nr:hypothetical protein K2173_017472 [Erythroxylum novogranatense]